MLSVLVIGLVPKSIFFNHFFIILYYKAFEVVNPKSIEKEYVCLRFNAQYAPPVSAFFVSY